jgi:hypothetical protein
MIESEFLGLWQGILLIGIAGAIVMITLGAVRSRTSGNASMRQRFTWFRLQVTGIISAPWYFFSLVFLVPGLASGSLATYAVFWTGFVLSGFIVPMIPIALRFGVGSLMWSRSSMPLR